MFCARSRPASCSPQPTWCSAPLHLLLLLLLLLLPLIILLPKTLHCCGGPARQVEREYTVMKALRQVMELSPQFGCIDGSGRWTH